MNFNAVFDKHYKLAVNRNQTANSELKRAAMTSTEIKNRIRNDVFKEVDVLKKKHKMFAGDEDIGFLVSGYMELYLGLASAYHSQTAYQKQQAKQEGGLKSSTRDQVGLDATGNGTVEIDGVEIKINDKEAQGI